MQCARIQQCIFWPLLLPIWVRDVGARLRGGVGARPGGGTGARLRGGGGARPGGGTGARLRGGGCARLGGGTGTRLRGGCGARLGGGTGARLRGGVGARLGGGTGARLRGGGGARLAAPPLCPLKLLLLVIIHLLSHTCRTTYNNIGTTYIVYDNKDEGQTSLP